MQSAFPLRPSVDHTPRTESSVVLGDDASTSVLESLGSETARSLLSALADGPATASDLAETAETSLQNAHYHLTNLQEAGLVTAAGTWYSSKGREMTVYALTSERIALHISPVEGEAPAESEQPFANPSTVMGLSSD